MRNIDLYSAFHAIDDDILERSETAACERKKKAGWLKWGAMVACLGVIFTVSMLALPNILKGPGGVLPPPNPNPGSVVGNGDDRSDHESTQPSGERSIIINWDGVAVNESKSFSPDGSRLYRDPELYDETNMGEDEVLAYYGWNLAPAYIPEGLTDGNNAPGGYLCREKATGKVIEDQAGRGFWVDFWEDGSPKSNDDLYIPTGFTIQASKLGILHCALLPVDDERTTDFGGVNVTITHCSMKHGPFDPTQKAPDGLSNMPAGYYDIYTASFILDGIEYEIMAQRLELEEVIKITASIINMPYRENFTVGGSQNLPDKGSTPTEYPYTTIVPGFDLDEPSEPVTP